MSIDLDAVLDLLVDKLADKLAAKLGQQQPADAWVPLKEAGAPVKSLRKALRAGELEGRKVGREIMVKRSAVERWISNRPEPKATSADEHERLLQMLTGPKRRGRRAA